MATYVTADAALTDALRLSRGMSYKNALADLATGGGKAVLYRTAPNADRAAVFQAFGDAVEMLGGRYVTAEDVGTSVADMEVVARRTRYVAGLPTRSGQAGGDPSPWTALGVFVSIEAALDRPLSGSRIAVQGLGSVGYKLCERLHEAGARLVVADVDAERVRAAQRAFGAEAAAVDRIHAVAAEVFSPNALGGVLNIDSIPELGAQVVCGGANNQLATPQDGERLFARGVVYAPDYVVNAGGIINVMAEYNGEPGAGVEARVLRIGERVRDILTQARAEHRSADQVADTMARSRIGRGFQRAA
jgi:leucine dehydrogenase